MEAKHNSDSKPSTGGHFLNFGALNGRFEGPPGYLGALPQALLDPAQPGWKVATVMIASAGNSKWSFGAHWGSTDALRPLFELRSKICVHCRRNFSKTRKPNFKNMWDAQKCTF